MPDDVDVLEIREETYYRLPAHIQEMIRAYGGGIAVARNRFLLFRVPHSRMDEILSAIRETGHPPQS